jgi:hypothetical protein
VIPLRFRVFLGPVALCSRTRRLVRLSRGGLVMPQDDLLSLERTATWDAVAQADALLARTRQKLDAPVKRKSGGSADLLSPKDIEAKYSSRAV